MLECRNVMILIRVPVEKPDWKDMPPIPNSRMRFTCFRGKWVAGAILLQQD